MSQAGWTERVLALLHRMNRFHSPGSSRASCLRWEVGGVQVGWIPPHVAPLLRRHPDVFEAPRDGAVALSRSLDSYRKRSEALDAVLQTLRLDSSLTCLGGWRDESYSVMAAFSDPPLMKMERAATSLFGVKRYGVHINGYTLGAGGAGPPLHMWLARRSRTKQTYPGLLDNLAAGGLAAGASVRQTVLKECEEEARIPAALAEQARPVSTVSYTYDDEDGVYAETQFCFDLQLPQDFQPRVGDGEVQDFHLLPIDQVKELLATEDFKPNCAMVVLDFLIRHSFIHPDAEPSYQALVAGLHHTL